MAFSFDTFATDQKQSAIDIVDTITPSQVKQVGAAYKAGLNTSPKQVINETLESFTGVDLSQGAGVDGLGAQAKNFIEGQAADLTMQLEQQILGCINTAIRDLMNKVPAVDFILNFEDRINGILGKFRNKLEFKIDAELRKLTYQKIKVHQVALFKQRIRGKIKDICPAATPASVAEVQDFNNKIKGFINKRSMDNTVIDTTKTLTTDKINEAKAEVKSQFATPFEGISNKRKQTFQQDPVETKKIVDEKVAQASAEVKQETEDQLEKKEDETIQQLVDTETTAELIGKRWLGIFTVDHYRQDPRKWYEVDSALLEIYMAMNKDVLTDPSFTTSDWWTRYYSLAIHNNNRAVRMTLPESGGYISILYLRQAHDAFVDSMTGQWDVTVVFRLDTRKFEDRSKWGLGAQSKNYNEWLEGEELPSKDWEGFKGHGSSHMAATLDAIGGIKKEIERQETEQFPIIIPSKKGKVQDWLKDE